ncbi:spore coat associated protein YheD [Bacillus subtilis]|uniref:spore coat associated protein YheD n=1 Tax=Bacillus subtilis TaxID=1423 RepID=UPI00132ED9F0|nr:spore coat associated protein YheD [Bacillus subtilis]MBO3636930.1 spore coat associated protein YheD [Bacillus subtilis]MCT6514347.1 spore coat associated protein YheD [Bacillus subtilis]MCX4075784.1 spore coat associated protein YheD [Bacillus subtilis]MEC0397872.1 spore coat associated protein YheD [Bacillus subtilis]MEC0435000.1 spore coat associated protein YheD [Bacillus subtilis]
MNPKRFLIGIDKTSENTLFLPSSLKRDGLLHAAFGTKVVRCHVAYRRHLEQTVLLSENLFHELLLPHRSRADILIHDHTVHIGPLVGIFTAGFTVSLERPFKDRSLFFSKLVTLHEQAGGYCFVFGAHQINWEEGTIEGLLYRENGWEKKIVPLPNVVYDRLPNRKIEDSLLLQHTKKRLIDEYQIPWFNKTFFNKWNVHQLLEKDPRTAPFLPRSELTPSVELIDELCGAYKKVYIKPANGALGTGIYQLKRTDGSLTVKHTNDAKTFTSIDYSDAASFLAEFQKQHNTSDFLIQQGVDLIEFQGKPADFRVHTNKNRKGKWTVTAIAVKISGKNSITTHLSNGGTVKTLAEVYDDPAERVEVIKKLSAAALTASHVLHDHIEGFIGEIGFDFGIDQNGKVWMFEANSRPGRSIFSHPNLHHVDSLTKRRSFEYASYLSEKAITSPEALWPS